MNGRLPLSHRPLHRLHPLEVLWAGLAQVKALLEGRERVAQLVEVVAKPSALGGVLALLIAHPPIVLRPLIFEVAQAHLREEREHTHAIEGERRQPPCVGDLGRCAPR